MDALNAFDIQPDGVETPDVAALLMHHFETMRANSPISSCHVMTPADLLETGVTLLSARENGVLLGVGGLRQLSADHGELKSMHTAQTARGRGVGRAVLLALMARAREMGLKRVSLETGTIDLFDAAQGLYAAEGFVACPPFGDYVPDPLSVFMTRSL